VTSSVSAAPSAVEPPPLPALRVPGWDQIPGLVAAFCGRQGGTSRGPFATLNLSARVGDDPAAVQRNWQRVTAAVGGGMRFVTMSQVHGADIATVEDTTRDVGAADAMVSCATSVALGVLTADCVPVLLVAPRERVVAAVHAGWRGTLAGIAARTLRHLREHYGVAAPAVRAALGPAIGACCYEVDATVADALEQRWGTLHQAIYRGAPTAAAKAHVDLRRVNRAQLVAAGMRSDAIVEVGPCTRCAATEYFSYRGAARAGGADTGRQLSCIGWRH
jgi:YfiH family protein